MKHSLRESLKREFIELLGDTFENKIKRFVDILFEGEIEGFYATDIPHIMDTSIEETFAVISTLSQWNLVKRYFEIAEDDHNKQLYDCLRDIPSSTTGENGEIEVGYPLDKISVYYKVIDDK